MELHLHPDVSKCEKYKKRVCTAIGGPTITCSNGRTALPRCNLSSISGSPDYVVLSEQSLLLPSLKMQKGNLKVIFLSNLFDLTALYQVIFL